jgi:hypothetical protein
MWNKFVLKADVILILNVENEFVKEELVSGVRKLINSFYTDVRTIFEVQIKSFLTF